MKATSKKAGIVGIALEDYLTDSNPEISLSESVTSTADSIITATTTQENILPSTSTPKKIMVLLAIKNNVQVNWDDVSISIIDNPNLGQEVSVDDYSFEGNIAVKDLVVTGKILVLGEMEVLGEATIKGNLNLDSALVREYLEAPGELLMIGDAVYIAGANQVARAYADNPNFKPAIGIVVGLETSSDNLTRTVKVAFSGTIKGFKDLIPGAVYFLSPIITQTPTNNQQPITDNQLATTTATVSDQQITGEEQQTTTATSTDEAIILSSLTPIVPNQLGYYIQTVAIAESENSLLIMPSLTYQEYTNDTNLPAVNYNPIYIDNVTIEQTANDNQQTTDETSEATTTTEVEQTTDDNQQTTDPSAEPGTDSQTTENTTPTEPTVEVVEPTETQTEPQIEVVE